MIATDIRRIEPYQVLLEEDLRKKTAMMPYLAQECRVDVMDILHDKGTGHWGEAAIAETLGKLKPSKIDFISVEDRFAESGDCDDLLARYGIPTDAIVKKATQLLNT